MLEYRVIIENNSYRWQRFFSLICYFARRNNNRPDVLLYEDPMQISLVVRILGVDFDVDKVKLLETPIISPEIWEGVRQKYFKYNQKSINYA